VPRLVADAAISCAIAAVLVAAQVEARGARVVAPGASVRRAAGPAGVLEEWRRAGVRGRTLVHVARPVGLGADPGPATEANFVERAVHEGLVRRILHVVSEADWPEVERHLQAMPAAAGAGGGYRVVDRGTPVVVTRLGDLPRASEPVLVDVDVDRLSDAELAALAARLRQGSLRSDLVLWYGARTPNPLEPLGAAAE